MARRNKSTEFLKECIADALLKLMEEKTLSQITVLEITNTAGVGRATFFRHFSSKEDVLTFKLLLLWERWAQEHELIDISKFSLYTTKELFSFNLSIKPLLQKLYTENLQNCVYDAFSNIMAPQFGSDVVQCYANRFYTYGCFAMVDEWIKRGFLETPEQMADIIIHEIVGKNVTLTEKEEQA